MQKKNSKGRVFYAAISKNKKIFTGNGCKGVKKQVKKKGIASHNVIMFLCTQRGGDGELTIKQIGRKPNFRIDGAQQKNLIKVCKCFST